MIHVYLNDGYLQMNLNGLDYPDVPAAYDDNGNVFSFIDGHVEYHKWLWNTTTASQGLKNCPYKYGVTGFGVHWGSSAQDTDYKWLYFHTACSQRRITNNPASPARIGVQRGDLKLLT